MLNDLTGDLLIVLRYTSTQSTREENLASCTESSFLPPLEHSVPAHFPYQFPITS